MAQKSLPSGWFKIGDEAIVTGDQGHQNHYFAPGTEVTVTQIHSTLGTNGKRILQCRSAAAEEWWVNEVDLDPLVTNEEEAAAIASILRGGDAVTQAAQEAVEPIPATVFTVLAVEDNTANGTLVELLGVYKTLRAAKKRCHDRLVNDGYDAPSWSPYEDPEIEPETKVVSMLVTQDYELNCNPTLFYISEMEVQDG